MTKKEQWRVQCRLKSGNAQLTAWLDPRAKVGKFVTLKDSFDPEQRWEIISVGEPQLLDKINKDWHVGGL